MIGWFVLATIATGALCYVGYVIHGFIGHFKAFRREFYELTQQASEFKEDFYEVTRRDGVRTRSI